MTRYRVDFDGILRRQNTGETVTDRAEIQAIVDRILLELSKIAAIDPAVQAQPDAQISVKVSVEESEVFMASVAGFTQIRTAVHAAGLGTPGWKVEWLRTTTDSSHEASHQVEVAG